MTGIRTDRTGGKNLTFFYRMNLPPFKVWRVVSYNKKRYTIEFRQEDDGKYYIEQIQSECDRGCPGEVKEWVKSFLK